MTATKIKLIVLLFCITFDIAAQDKNFKDTINIIDATGKKQGHWIVFGQTKINSCYKPDQTVEEGLYKDNKKTGVWTEYFCNGIKKSIINFSAGVPDGQITIYYQDGKLREEGTWKNNRWIGRYKVYNTDGTMQEFNFDENGKKILADPK